MNIDETFEPEAGQDSGPNAPRPAPRPRPVQAQKGSIVKYKAALRKAKRKNAREPEIDFLNITAMLDLMTIILVFLLKSLASSAGAIPQSDDLRLPQSVMVGEPSDEGVLVVVSKTQILVGEESTPVVTLPSREQLAQSGIEAKHKRSGPNDLYIVPLANSLQHAREIDKAVRAAKGLDPSTSEARIVADKTTPYRLLIEVLYTLGQSEFGKYHLMILSGKK
ncbi:ExbD/TolR family protein [Polyangium jinanense]|uniref:Biopolymer transporter ExbD n=1 Tax=Polyangium jinanense TaxID=2829994 RepID=A0A9X4AV41_9BACT|nr:biopolymer transporter ExbD [Polyangium jinanense]MDC3961713.1 biopolymer transporter ExbD [Polyangium jinanense]MDC3983900.1 biopolymer transporter ExbD [Polyangium jinanense]MDC3987239.1 biopolymer transporter ExbD [Polyangium jinanense]